MNFPLAIITDTHLHKNNKELVRNLFNQLLTYCEKNNINTVIHCGDVFDERPKIEIEVYLTWRAILKQFEEKNIMLYVIPGNHDKQNQKLPESHLTMFEYNPNVELIDNWHYQLHEIPFVNNNNLYFLPYFPIDFQKGTLKAAKKLSKNPTILFTHAPINGASNNDGSIVNNGIPLEILEKFDLVISGHYHNRKKVGSNVWYIGSSHQANFSEDEHKGFAVLDADLKLDFVSLDFPKYLTYPIVLETIDPTSFNEVFEYVKENSNDRIRVKMSTPYEQQDLSLINELTDLGVRFEYPKPTVTAHASTFKQLTKLDIVEIFENFAKDNNIIQRVKNLITKYI